MRYDFCYVTQLKFMSQADVVYNVSFSTFWIVPTHPASIYHFFQLSIHHFIDVFKHLTGTLWHLSPHCVELLNEHFETSCRDIWWYACVFVSVVMVVFSGPRRVIALRAGPITEQTSKRELVLCSLHPSININLFFWGRQMGQRSGEERHGE